MLKILSIFRKLRKYGRFLYEEEKSEKTIKKYLGDIIRFRLWIEDNQKGIMISKYDV